MMKSLFTLSFLLCLIFIGCDSTSLAPSNTEEASIKMKPLSEFEEHAVGSTAAKKDEGEEEELKIKVEGERIPLDFFGLNEFDTYEVESENGEVEGDFSVEVFDPVSGELLEDAQGEITCVTVEKDRHTARLGGFLTASNTLPFLIGTFAVWTVVDHGKGGDETTDLRIGVPEWVRDFHCDIGFPVEAFGGTFQSTSGDIEVEVEKD